MPAKSWKGNKKGPYKQPFSIPNRLRWKSGDSQMGRLHV
jgi:hypothetical protein